MATARQDALASAMAELVRERCGEEAFLALCGACGGIPAEAVERKTPMFGIGTAAEGPALSGG